MLPCARKVKHQNSRAPPPRKIKIGVYFHKWAWVSNFYGPLAIKARNCIHIIYFVIFRLFFYLHSPRNESNAGPELKSAPRSRAYQFAWPSTLSSSVVLPLHLLPQYSLCIFFLLLIFFCPKLNFLLYSGAGQEVGKSCVVVTINGKRIMFDCGMHMGYLDHRRYPDFSRIPKSQNESNFDHSLTCIIITHL